jgi:hypothetical protein
MAEKKFTSKRAIACNAPKAAAAAAPSSRPYPTNRLTTEPFFCSIQIGRSWLDCSEHRAQVSEARRGCGPGADIESQIEPGQNVRYLSLKNDVLTLNTFEHLPVGQRAVVIPVFG